MRANFPYIMNLFGKWLSQQTSKATLVTLITHSVTVPRFNNWRYDPGAYQLAALREHNMLAKGKNLSSYSAESSEFGGTGFLGEGSFNGGLTQISSWNVPGNHMEVMQLVQPSNLKGWFLQWTSKTINRHTQKQTHSWQYSILNPRRFLHLYIIIPSSPSKTSASPRSEVSALCKWETYAHPRWPHPWSWKKPTLGWNKGNLRNFLGMFCGILLLYFNVFTMLIYTSSKVFESSKDSTCWTSKSGMLRMTIMCSFIDVVCI